MPYIQYPSLGGGASLPSNSYLYWDNPNLKLYTYNLEVTGVANFNTNAFANADFSINGIAYIFGQAIFSSTLTLENGYTGGQFFITSTSFDGVEFADDTFTGKMTIKGDNGIDFGAITMRTQPSGGSFTVDNTVTYSTNFGFEHTCNDITSGAVTLIQIRPGSSYKIDSTDPIILESDNYVQVYNPNGGSPAMVWVNNGTGPAYCIRMNDAGGSLMWGVQANGAVFMGSMDDADAQNGSIYYSTNQTKLVYKDAGGTVNLLY